MTIILDLRPLLGGKTSGVEVYTHQLIKNILELDKKNTYILFANAYAKQNIFSQFSEYSNVVTVQTRIPNKIFNFALAIFKRPKIDRLILNYLKKRTDIKIEKIDVFLMPDLRPSQVSSHVKKICVIHDLSFHHFPQFFSWKTRLWYKILQAKREISSSDAIIAVSNFTKSDLEKSFQVSAQKIKVVHEAVDDDFCNEVTDQISLKVQKKYSLPQKYFLFLATLEPRKNMLRLIDAFQIYKKNNPNDPIQLVLAGQKNEKIFSTIKLKRVPDVHIPGFIDETDKATVMKNAEAFLYPSLFEGFGLPLLEAMKCSTPIITSNTSSMPEVCGNAALFINPENKDEIAAAMEEIRKPEVRSSLKKEMLEQIKKFSWKKCAQETLDIII